MTLQAHLALFSIPIWWVQQHGTTQCPLAGAHPWQGPTSPPVPPQGAPGGSGRLLLPGEEASPPGVQLLPRVLEPAASKAAGPTPPLTIQVQPIADNLTTMIFNVYQSYLSHSLL